jgi:hypothetical protein
MRVMNTLKNWSNKRDRFIRYGTFNKSDVLDGIGGKLRIWAKSANDPLVYERIYVWEG